MDGKPAAISTYYWLQIKYYLFWMYKEVTLTRTISTGRWQNSQQWCFLEPPAGVGEERKAWVWSQSMQGWWRYSGWVTCQEEKGERRCWRGWWGNQFVPQEAGLLRVNSVEVLVYVLQRCVDSITPEALTLQLRSSPVLIIKTDEFKVHIFTIYKLCRIWIVIVIRAFMTSIFWVPRIFLPWLALIVENPSATQLWKEVILVKYSLLIWLLYLGDPQVVGSPLGPSLFISLFVCRHLTRTYNITVPSWWNHIKLSLHRNAFKKIKTRGMSTRV